MMDVEMIKAIGLYIVVPICVAGFFGFVAYCASC